MKKPKTKEIEGSLLPISKWLDSYGDQLGDGERQYIGIETGDKAIDEAFSGLHGVIVLGGEAGGGKTTIATHFARRVAEKGTPVLFYSLEMPREDILNKLLSSLSEVGYSDIVLRGRSAFKGEGDGKLNKQKADRIVKGKRELEKFTDYIYIRTGSAQEQVTFEQLEKDIRQLKEQHKTGNVFVVIDHLQMFTPRKPSKEIRDTIDKEQDIIDNFVKAKKDTGACFLLISQQNKAGYNEVNPRSIKGTVDNLYKPDIVMIIKSAGEKKIGEDGVENIFSDIAEDTTGDPMKLVIIKNRYGRQKAIGFMVKMEYSQIIFDNSEG